MFRLVAVAMVLAAASQPPPAPVTTSVEQCLPRDEAAQTPDFFSFRAQLGNIWQELASVIALGGTFDTPHTFVAGMPLVPDRRRCSGSRIGTSTKVR